MAAPTPLTWNLYVAAVANLAVLKTQTTGGVVEGVDAQFNTMLPGAVQYAELRIQRDLDLLPSQTSQDYALTTGNNQLQLGVADFVTVQTVMLTVNGATLPLTPVSKEFLQNVCGTQASTGIPVYFAMAGGDQATGGNTYNNILVGPYPDDDYAVTIYGTQRLPSLYAYANAGQAAVGTTFISSQLPDMLVQASMIVVSQYQRNFGAQAPSSDGAVSYTHLTLPTNREV